MPNPANLKLFIPERLCPCQSIEDGHCPNVGSNCPILPASIIQNSTTYGTLAVGKQSASPESDRTASLVPAESRIRAKHVFLVHLNLGSYSSIFPPSRRPIRPPPAFPQHYFSRLIAAHIRAYIDLTRVTTGLFRAGSSRRT